MSELKWNWCYLPYLDPPEKQKESALKAGYIKVVDKSEADKVIAELKADYKEACDRLQTANLIKDEQLAATRRQKYKRCLDKAELWLERYENSTDKENAEVSYMRYEKWIKLAEKFK